MTKRKTKASETLARFAKGKPSGRHDRTSFIHRASNNRRILEKVVSFQGTYFRLYSVGALARALGRSSATIRRWQRQGIVLPPLIKTSDGIRWYLQEEIDMYVRLSNTYPLTTGISYKDTGFPEAARLELKDLRERLERTINTANP